MLGWIFKRKASGEDGAKVLSPTAQTAASSAVPGRLPDAPSPPPVDWAQRLSQAQGDDTALLELAGSRAPIDIRQAAVEAIESEALLKSAERTFRERDRRLARSAKQRHTALAAQREARTQAASLIDNARALAGLALIPLNRLAELDRAWQALDPARLDPAQGSDFAAAMNALSSLSRERGDAQLTAERWAARAHAALAALQRITAEAAAGTRDLLQLAEARDAARGVLAAVAGIPAAPNLADALEQSLRTAELVEERIAFLEALPDPAAEAAHEAATDPDPGWQALPRIDDAALRDPLEARYSAWRQARVGARQAARARQSELAKSTQRATRQEEAAALDAALEGAERALAEGRLDAAGHRLGEVASWLSRGGIGEAQRTRAGAAQADYARLKGWQQWGGGVAREELVSEAEALAAGGTEATAQPSPPLPIKALGETIARLRARWKELDRLGGAGGGALWRRFDDALTAAYQPVAAHAAAQRAAREQNLTARQELLEALEAVALPGPPPDAASAPRASGEPDFAAAAIIAPDWKAVAQTLDRWLAEWRKLGPLEHTVPREQREPLLARTRLALARLELPLGEARQAAQAVREQLIARARRLADEAASGVPGRDLTGRVRELQASWQQHAKAMPLARAAESAAWVDFRAALDAVFSARAAASSAHDAALQANAAERSELIDRLTALPGDLNPAALRRELVETDAVWHRTGPPPREAAESLDARFRAAREAAVQRLADAEQQRQRAEADALQQKLALCEALESGDPGFDSATLNERWQALPTLRGAWEQALAQRAGLPAGKPMPTSAAPAEALLLQLEESLGLASPPALQEARRALKLQAMKAALEGRGSVAQSRHAGERTGDSSARPKRARCRSTRPARAGAGFGAIVGRGVIERSRRRQARMLRYKHIAAGDPSLSVSIRPPVSSVSLIKESTWHFRKRSA